MKKSILIHELTYRQDDALEKIEQANILVCGIGALGSNLVENLYRQGFIQLTAIDDDIVEEHNIGTQTYCLYDVGSPKVVALSRKIYRDIQCQLQSIQERLTKKNISILSDYDLVIDTFDNHYSRKLVSEYCKEHKIACLHGGMSDDGYSQVVWNNNYIVPKDYEDAVDICEYPLARNLVVLTSTFLAEIIMKYVIFNTCFNLDFTLGDLKTCVGKA